jgi:hypothetical protein
LEDSGLSKEDQKKILGLNFSKRFGFDRKAS